MLLSPSSDSNDNRKSLDCNEGGWDRYVSTLFMFDSMIRESFSVSLFSSAFPLLTCSGTIGGATFKAQMSA